MSYGPDLVEFSHILFTHSPMAYDNVRDILTLPDPRTLRIQRARLPRFPIGIQPRTFELVCDTLTKLNYSGPVALSCDDSKLLASFRPYYDEEKEAYFIMGHVGEPYQLVDHESFRRVVMEKKLEKATKLRLFCLQVPIPKVPTIIVAALAIPENLAAPDLIGYTWDILTGLLERNVSVASYATDGSNVERSVSALLEERATRVEEIRFKHPADDGTEHNDIIIPIFYFGSQPVAILQDPKHLLKTFRNNVFSGAQVPILPNHAILFSDIRSMAMSDSPIYKRDVTNVDRQDDNAATRLFSGATLDWLSSRHPELRGLIVFLFICGEMIDAYQSRSLSIEERVQMILRAQFFFEFWEKFIEVGGYSKAKHYLSPQCTKILKMLIRGFLQLVVIYRGYNGMYALLPWLLCTEAVEHVFGMCRQIIKDFTMHDFHLMVPKLFIKLRRAFFRADTTDGKARANGYSHTHTDIRDIDFGMLSSFPTDVNIQQASTRAYGEAHSIFSYLGLTPEQLYGSVVRFPGISTWYTDQDNIDSDSECDSDSLSSDNVDDTPNYQDVLDSLEDLDGSISEQENRRLMDFRYATVALTVDDQMSICRLPEFDDDARTEALSDDASHISTILASIGNSIAMRLPPVNVNDHTNAFELNLDTAVDLSELVRLRFRHQTKQAATGIRTMGVPSDSTIPSASVKPLTERQRILREFSQILKQQEDQGVGTGLERKFRWKSDAYHQPDTLRSNGQDNAQESSPNGNSANAVAAAKVSATKVSFHA
ncbi:hypothetical protein BDN70DRAFT_818838 [Pholiota conissans]|uniref:THAP9-like helix-turn-helix domain-containing protein n=1 Tax=Pholiota conissans TaxID=109636 RepID=A0A9P5YM41_9AGAR|nr:hypothetical protein BDN70DRAFT_818838 [Pholiota conissans]